MSNWQVATVVVGLAALCCLAGIAAAGEVQIDLKDPANWNVGGQGYDPKSAVLATDEKSPEGGQALTLRYAHAGVGNGPSHIEYCLKDAPQLVGMPKAISLYIKGDKQNQPLDIRFVDANGRIHHWYTKHVAWDGWQKMTFPLVVGARATPPGAERTRHRIHRWCRQSACIHSCWTSPARMTGPRVRSPSPISV